jgi:hypothetical protein
MGSGCFTIAVDVPFSHDVLHDGGIFYQKRKLTISQNAVGT